MRWIMKYTKEQRLEIGRKIYENELSRCRAAEIYDIGETTARDYMRMYRDAQGPRRTANTNVEATPAKKPSPSIAGMGELEAMTKEELIREVVKARIAEARLKKGYEVKGDGTVILYGSVNIK